MLVSGEGGHQIVLLSEYRRLGASYSLNRPPGSTRRGGATPGPKVAGRLRAFLLILGLSLLGRQSSAHRLCATATLSAGHAMLVAFFFQVSRHLLSRMLLPSLYCDEAWTRSTHNSEVLIFIGAVRLSHGTWHSFRVQLPCRTALANS